jgi:hypothetical protein
MKAAHFSISHDILKLMKAPDEQPTHSLSYMQLYQGLKGRKVHLVRIYNSKSNSVSPIHPPQASNIVQYNKHTIIADLTWYKPKIIFTTSFNSMTTIVTTPSH